MNPSDKSLHGMTRSVKETITASSLKVKFVEVHTITNYIVHTTERHPLAYKL